MILGILVVIVVCVLIVNYFRGITKPSGQPGQPETVSAIPTISGEVQAINPQDLPTSYKVKAGDNLWRIAEKIYGSGYNWVDIAKENHLKNPNVVRADQELTIPKAEPIKPKIVEKESISGSSITEGTYTVAKGDNLWKIAVRAYGDGFQWVKIAQENKLVNPRLIHSGNVLKLPR